MKKRLTAQESNGQRDQRIARRCLGGELEVLRHFAKETFPTAMWQRPGFCFSEGLVQLSIFSKDRKNHVHDIHAITCTVLMHTLDFLLLKQRGTPQNWTVWQIKSKPHYSILLGSKVATVTLNELSSLDKKSGKRHRVVQNGESCTVRDFLTTSRHVKPNYFEKLAALESED